MWGTRAFALVVGLTAALLMPAGARAEHQPGDIDTKVFKATIDATGQFSGTGVSQGGGEWSMQASPFWKVVYPDLAVSIDGDEAFTPAVDYAFSGATAGTVTWAGTAQYDFQTEAPEPFSCVADLPGPKSAGPPQGFANLVQGQGDNVRFELSALNQFGVFGTQGGCSPQASGFAVGWSLTIGNNTQVFASIPREELFEEDSITKNVQFGSGNAHPQCFFGCTSAALTWSGTLKLEKNCRNYAGTATTFTQGPITVTNPYCESDCNVSDCSQADLELIPLARPAKEDGGEVEFAVSCYGEETCTGKHLLQAAGTSRRAGAKLGSGTFAVDPVAHADTTVKLARAGKKMLKKDGKIKATLRSELEGENVADPATDSLKVTIKPG